MCGVNETEQRKSSRVRGRGRPSRPLLTPEGITAAALKLIAERGESGFTMAALARELHVSASALYNHADSKDVILRWVQDDLNSTIDVACFVQKPLVDAMLVWARSYRRAYAAHPALISVMAWQPVADAPHTIAMYETVTSALVGAGFAPAEALRAIVAVESFLFGSALDTAAPDDIFDLGEAAAHAPVFAQAVSQREQVDGRGRGSADASFELGLEALVRALLAGH